MRLNVIIHVYKILTSNAKILILNMLFRKVPPQLTLQGTFTLSNCQSEHEIFLCYFALLDMISSVQINNTQLFSMSLSQSQSLSVKEPFKSLRKSNILC